MNLVQSDFVKKYKHPINRGISFFHIKNIFNMMYFDFDVYLPTIGKNLQRDLVWTPEQKSSLIVSIFREQPINVITVIQREETINSKRYYMEVIDGKQRLTTIKAFINNGFPFLFKGNYYFFNDLSDELKNKFYGSHCLKFDVHYHYSDSPISDQTKIDIFEEINWLGTPQDVQHLKELRNGI